MNRVGRTPLVAAVSLLAAVGLLGCAAGKQPRDYGLYRTHMPRSILVLPPLNDSMEVDASYVYLSTVTMPLAEAGYYVFPVAVVDNFMKENGLPTPVEMHGVSLDKLREVFGADAVLYIHIEDWGQKYVVLASNTVLKARARLVDVRTGTPLWEGAARAVDGSGDGGGGILGMMIAAAITQVVDTATDRTHRLSAVANANMVFDTENGLLRGAYHPEYGSDARGR